MLTVDKANIYYGDMRVIWGVSFKINEGEITSLVGSNGAGKSTILKAISGLQNVKGSNLLMKSGSINFEGERIDTKPPNTIVDLGISHIPEGRRIFPNYTILENLEMGAYKDFGNRKEIKKRLNRVYELFPILRERKKQLGRTLSGGEQQMLAIGRGMMANPKLLLLDEPSLGLAPKIVKSMLETVKIINEEGTTILLVEQNIRLSLGLVDRAYVLETGRIVLEGTGKQLLNNEHVKRAYLGI